MIFSSKCQTNSKENYGLPIKLIKVKVLIYTSKSYDMYQNSILKPFKIVFKREKRHITA
jgi:hypothetical protein